MVRGLLRLPAPTALACRAGRMWVKVHPSGRSQVAELWECGEHAIRQRRAVTGPFALDAWGEPWMLTKHGDGQEVLIDPLGNRMLMTAGVQRLVPHAQGVALINAGGELFCLQAGLVRQSVLGVEPRGYCATASGLLWIGQQDDGRWLLRHGRRPCVALSRELQRRLKNTGPVLITQSKHTTWLHPKGTDSCYRIDRNGDLRAYLEMGEEAIHILGDKQGGVFALLPGALARFDHQGTRRPGQGGFGACEDLAWA